MVVLAVIVAGVLVIAGAVLPGVVIEAEAQVPSLLDLYVALPCGAEGRDVVGLASGYA